MQQQYPPLAPRCILGIAAHPDDLEFGAGGTLAKYASNGASVHLLILTDGSKGTADRNMKQDELVQGRHSEEQAALQRMGGKSVEFLDYTDGELEATMDLKRDIVRHIRKIKPDLVITIDPTMVYSAKHGSINHPDHRVAGQATLDTVFPFARDHLAFPELLEEGHEPHKTPTVLLINFDNPTYFEDITDSFDQKCAIMAAHVSQGFQSEAVKHFVEQLAREAGKAAGCQYAEAFARIDIRMT